LLIANSLEYVNIQYTTYFNTNVALPLYHNVFINILKILLQPWQIYVKVSKFIFKIFK